MIKPNLAFPWQRLFRLSLVFLFAALLLGACSNMRWGTSAGVDVRFGPNGPKVVPTMNVSMYSGGRF